MLTKLSAFQSTLQARAQRQDQERELWERWKKTGDQMALQELFRSLQPLIQKISWNYTGNLPPAFIEGEVKKQVMKALESYDPARGTQLNTHIQNRTQKVLREIYKYQNPLRLAEESHLKIPAFQNVYDNLQSQLAREPTQLELAREMNTSIAEIRRLKAGMRRDLGAVEGGLLWRPAEKDRQKEILDLVYYELNPQEQQVLEYLYGLNGKPELAAKDIAVRMSLTPARVSQIKTRISSVVDRYFGPGQMK